VAARASRAKKRREKKEAEEKAKKQNEEPAKNTEAPIEEEYYIVLNYGSMKEMLNQYEANNSINAG